MKRNIWNCEFSLNRINKNVIMKVNSMNRIINYKKSEKIKVFSLRKKEKNCIKKPAPAAEMQFSIMWINKRNLWESCLKKIHWAAFSIKGFPKRIWKKTSVVLTLTFSRFFVVVFREWFSECVCVQTTYNNNRNKLIFLWYWEHWALLFHLSWVLFLFI